MSLTIASSGKCSRTDPSASVDSGQKLEHLTPIDQLQCRIVYATAAPIHLPDRIAGDTRRTVARQLRQDAESMADSLAIWRKPDPRHVAPLVLLYKTFSTEDNKNDDAVPYLAAAISHCRVLAGRERSQPTVTAGGATVNVSWTLIIMDVLSSMERGRKPHLCVCAALLAKDATTCADFFFASTCGGATDLGTR